MGWVSHAYQDVCLLPSGRVARSGDDACMLRRAGGAYLGLLAFPHTLFFNDFMHSASQIGLYLLGLALALAAFHPTEVSKWLGNSVPRDSYPLSPPMLSKRKNTWSTLHSLDLQYYNNVVSRDKQF